MRSSDRIHNAFDAVKAGEELKSLTKDYLRTARRRVSRRERRAMAGKPVFRRAMVMVSLCAMLFLMLGSGGYFLLGVPVSYVSIDVNPSIELVLNRLDRVISAEAYNEDGTSVLNAASVGGMYYTEAIERLVESEAMQPYLSQNAGLTFTVASDSGQRENALLAGIENTSGCREHGGMGVGVDISTVQEAHDSGLSLGKYAAYQTLSQYDSSITAEDCHDMTISEIHGLIEEHEHGEHSEGGHNGSGQHEEAGGYDRGAGQSMDSSYGETVGYEDGEADSSYGETVGYEESKADSGYGETDGYEDSEADSGYGTDSVSDGYGEHGNGQHRTGHGHSHKRKP